MDTFYGKLGCKIVQKCHIFKDTEACEEKEISALGGISLCGSSTQPICMTASS